MYRMIYLKKQSTLKWPDDRDRGYMSMSKKKRITIILFYILVALCLTGCPGRAYSSEEKSGVENKGRDIITKYLGENLPEASLNSVFADDETLDSCGYLTDIVSGTFSYQDEVYKFSVNIKTNQVFTSLYTEELNNEIKLRILDKLNMSEDELCYVAGSIKYLQQMDIYDGDTLEYEDYIKKLDGVIPAEIVDVKQQVDDIMNSTDYVIYIDVLYWGDQELSSLDVESMELAGTNLEVKKYDCKMTNESPKPANIIEEMTYGVRFNDYSRYFEYVKWGRCKAGELTCAYEAYTLEKNGDEVKEQKIELGRNFFISLENDIVTIENPEQLKFRKYIYADESSSFAGELRRECQYALCTGKIDDSDTWDCVYGTYEWTTYNGVYTIKKRGGGIEDFDNWTKPICEICLGNAAAEILEEEEEEP